MRPRAAEGTDMGNKCTHAPFPEPVARERMSSTEGLQSSDRRGVLPECVEVHSISEQKPDDQADVPWWRPASWVEHSPAFPDGALRTVEPMVPVLFDALRAMGPYSDLEDESARMGLPPFAGLECGAATMEAGGSSSSRG